MAEMRAFFVLLLCACAAVARAGEDSGEALFVERHRCVISQIFNRIRATPLPKEDGQNRFLILYPTRDDAVYAQCAFFDRDVSIHCEVASPFYQRKGAQAARLPAIARLGYDLDASKGNYVREFEVDAEGSPPLAEFLLRSLYAAFLDDPATPLSFRAPLVKVSPSPKGCAPGS